MFIPAHQNWVDVPHALQKLEIFRFAAQNCDVANVNVTLKMFIHMIWRNINRYAVNT